jgi:hypothetical protein
MGRDKLMEIREDGPSPRYRVTWLNAEWEGQRVVEHATQGETISYLINFLNTRRKLSSQPDLFAGTVDRNAVALTVEAE